MTHLTQVHTVIGVIGKVVANISAMRIMAGYTAHLPAAPLFGGIVHAA